MNNKKTIIFALLIFSCLSVAFLASGVDAVADPEGRIISEPDAGLNTKNLQNDENEKAQKIIFSGLAILITVIIISSIFYVNNKKNHKK